MRKKTTYMITVFLLSIVILCCVFPIIKVNAFDTQPEKTIIYSDDWFNPLWLNRWKINISWIHDETLYEHQVSVKIQSSFDYSQMKDDGSDIRFTDYRNNEVPHWIENWNPGGVSRIWVNVPRINGNPSTADFIYMYYGNSEAESTSSGEETFLFFDDFENQTIGLRPNNWEVTQGDAGDILLSDESFIGERSAHYFDNHASSFPIIWRNFGFDAKNKIIECYVKPNFPTFSGGLVYSSNHGTQAGANLIFFHGTSSWLFYWNGLFYEAIFDSFNYDEWYRISMSFRDKLTYNMSIYRGYDGAGGEAVGLPFVGNDKSINCFQFWQYALHDCSMLIDCLRVREGTNYGYNPSTNFVAYHYLLGPRSTIIGLTTILTISSFFTSFVFILMVIKRRKLSKKNN